MYGWGLGKEISGDEETIIVRAAMKTTNVLTTRKMVIARNVMLTFYCLHLKVSVF
jgi:hypothetical protein